jgi:filamentous hemagglutinin family protein
MNRDRYRLVFHTVLGMLVPVHEHVSSRPGRGTTRRHRRRLGAVAALVALGASVAWADGPDVGTIPIPVLDATGGANIASFGQVTAQTSALHGGQLLTVTQGTQRAIVDWATFDIAAGSAVHFAQPGVTASILNRIAGADPSRIYGSLTSTGEVYLLNDSGFVFGRGAQVATGSFVASALDIADDTFRAGLLSLQTAPGVATAAFSWGGTRQQFETTLIRVDDGAAISASTGGRVMLLAPTVQNSGTIATPEGQTIVAAGGRVYLTAPLDSSLRGFLVEVDPFIERDASGNPVADPVTGRVDNTTLGRILTERGNATLAAFAVNQNGRVSATTSVRLNGSIFLKAGHGGTGPDNSTDALRGGAVVLGAGSVTEVRPDTADRSTSLDAQGFEPSRVKLVGRTITLEDRASIVAPGGVVDLIAQARPPGALPTDHNFAIPGSSRDASVRVTLGAGSIIDVSGTEGVVIPVERNFVQAELRGNELRDSPLQRSGLLRGQTVTVDIRKGTPIGDVSGYTTQIQRGVAERTAIGGSITVRSEGDIVVREGSLLDVSGAAIRYTDGVAAETTLRGADGRLYRLSEASPDRVYTGFGDRYTVRSTRTGETETWHKLDVGEFQAGYVEGRSAGTVTLFGSTVVLDGDIAATRVVGPNQRDEATMPRGGSLVLGAPVGIGYELTASVAQFDARLGNVSIGTFGPQITGPLDATTPLPDGVVGTARLDAARLQRAGLSTLKIASNARIDVASGAVVDTGPLGRIEMIGREIDLGGSLVARGGDIALVTRGTLDSIDDPSLANPANPRTQFAIDLRAGARLDVAGTWTNDFVDARGGGLPTSVQALDGGGVSITSGRELRLAAGSMVDASAGGTVSRDGAIAFGHGGAVALRSGRVGAADADPSTAPLLLDGAISAFGGPGAGGSLALGASQVRIGGAPTGAAGELWLDSGFFTRGGFATWSVSGHNGLDVVDGTRLVPVGAALLADSAMLVQATGGRATSFATSAVLDPTLRGPQSVSFAATGPGRALTVGEDALIDVGARGDIALSANTQVTVAGSLVARGGRIGVSNAVASIADGGFRDDASVWLGAHARLDVSGTTLAAVDRFGRLIGEALDGGSVTLQAGRGYVVAEAGSTIDVRGAAGALDIARDVGTARPLLVRTPLASDAGRVELSAREGVFVSSTLRAQGGAADAAGGALVVSMRGEPLQFFPTAPRRIVLSDAPLAAADLSGLAPGEDIDGNAFGANPLRNGIAFVDADRIEAAGFDEVTLRARDAVEIAATGVSLSVRRSITVDAPVLSMQGGATANASFEAARATLGPVDTLLQIEPVLSTGAGALVVRADTIDLVGRFNVAGFSTARFEAQRDLRFSAIPVDTDPGAGVIAAFRGGLRSTADLDLVAARTFATTLSNYTIARVGADGLPAGTLRFGDSGTQALATPWSAGSVLTARAARIEQQGQVFAPLGSLQFEATERIDVAVGSTTSVSGAPRQIVDPVTGALRSVGDAVRVPLGRTELSGRDVVYPLGAGFGNLVLAELPTRRVEFDAPRVDFAGTVDVRGGGDVFLYEFTPGPGGSADVLDPARSPEAFAVLPGVTGRDAGPRDWHYSDRVTAFEDGDQILLAGVPGLASGAYSKLPARYALLPGAYLVMPRPGTTDLVASQSETLPDGSRLVPAVTGWTDAQGRFVGADRTEGWVVQSTQIVRNRAEYTLTDGAGAFGRVAGATVPGDAGALVLQARDALSIPGRLLSAAATPGRRGAQVDLVAERLMVIAPGGVADDGFIALAADDLSALGAESLLIGGERRRSAAGAVTIDVASPTSRVIVANDAQSALTAPELLFAAGDSVTLRDDASLRVDTTRAFPMAGSIAVTGDGALLRAGAGVGVGVLRTEVTQTAGTLVLGERVTIAATDASSGVPVAVTLDASLDTRVASTVQLGAESLDISAGRVSFGDVPTGTPGLVMGGALLEQAQAADAMRIRSYSSIDFHGAVLLAAAGGEPAAPVPLRSVTFDAAALRGFGDGDKTIVAESFTWTNTASTLDAGAPSADGTGVLRVVANGGDARVTLGAGDKRIEGVSEVRIEAARALRFDGEGALAIANRDVTVVTPEVTATSGAVQRLDAGEADVRLETGAASAATPTVADAAPVPLGASLVVAGRSVEIDTRVTLPSGRFEARASGADGVTEAITVGDRAVVDVAGREVRFERETVRATSGGTARFDAAQGDIRFAPGSRVDVSSGGTRADGGMLDLRAPGGIVRLEGTVVGAGANAGPVRGARLTLDALRIDDIGALAATLGDSGFVGGRSLRARSGDVVFGSGTRWVGRDLSVAADGGSITVGDATLDASGDKAGRIALWAAQDVLLGASATLDASADAVGASGGHVTVGVREGRIDAESSTRLDVRGGAASAGGARSNDGLVVLRAPRTADSLAIDAVPGGIEGASRVVLEGVRTYDDTSVNAADLATWSDDATAWMAAATVPGVSTIERLYGFAPDPTDTSSDGRAAQAAYAARIAGVSLRPGVEVVSPGDLTIASDLNFATVRPGGAAGVLTLRAGGNLVVNGHLSDGFNAVPTAAIARPTKAQLDAAWVATTGDAWSYRLTAGADAFAADPLAVVASDEIGDVIVGGEATNAARQIRTGNGFIDVAAGRDVVLANARSAIYTVGVADARIASFAPTTAVSQMPAPTWLSGGGDVRIAASRDARATPVAQAGTEWLYRDVRRVLESGRLVIPQNPQQAWWVRLDQFQQSVGAFGGGDVTIVAGRDVADFSAALPTNGRLVTPIDAAPSLDDLRVQGGGDLAVLAGRDVLGGTYTVLRGDASIVAQRDIAPGAVPIPAAEDDARLATSIALADADVRLDAGRHAVLGVAYNPTMVGQVLGTGGNTPNARQSYFFTYSDRAAVEVRALTGDTTFRADASGLARAVPQITALTSAYTFAPGSLRLLSFDGDVAIPTGDGSQIQLFPATRGQLELAGAGQVSIGRTVMMLDMSPTALPGVAALDVSGTPTLRWTRPVGSVEEATTLFGIDTGARGHDPAILRRDDFEAVRVVARDGDVVGPVVDGSLQQALSVAKAARIVAGRDVRDLWSSGQHVRDSDVSVVRAGRDVRFTTLRNPDGSQAPNPGEFQLAGEGALLVEAGRDVDLGNSNGIRTVGNANNPYFDERGAAIRVSVGQAETDYAAFFERYLARADDTIARGYLDRLRVVDGRAFLVVESDRDTPSDTGLRADEALAALRALPLDRQTEVANAILFAELRAGSVEFPSTGTYARAYEAAFTLFPAGYEIDAETGLPFVAADQATVVGALPPTLNAASAIVAGRAYQSVARAAYPGDINLFFSQLKTEQGGDIDLRVPGGLINAGLANPGALDKSAADLGIVTIRGGSVRSMSSGDFLVNQSRVFTLGGGDIALWSSFGNIDAGRGAKTATATPPPQIVFRGDRLVLDTSRSVSGSGIGVLLSRDDIVPGETLLAAPFGIVDAGDAGIRAAGNLTIIAALVQNALNIQVGGVASGVPVAAAPPPPPPPPPGDVAKAAAAAAESASAGAAASTAAVKPSFITVRVIGLGG